MKVLDAPEIGSDRPYPTLVSGPDAELIALCDRWHVLESDVADAWLALDDAKGVHSDNVEEIEAIAEGLERKARDAFLQLTAIPASTKEGLVAKAIVLARWFHDAEDERDIGARGDGGEDGNGYPEDLICHSMARDVRRMLADGIL